MNDLVLGQEATLDLFELQDQAERFPARRKNIFFQGCQMATTEKFSNPKPITVRSAVMLRSEHIGKKILR